MNRLYIAVLCMLILCLQHCKKETDLEKFLNSETPSFYADVSGDVAIADLGKTINLKEGKKYSLVSTHLLANPESTMTSFTSWEYPSGSNTMGITLASPVFEYRNDTFIENTFGEGIKMFDGNPTGYCFYIFNNHELRYTAADNGGYIKNRTIKILKYKRNPTHEIPNTGGYKEYIYVWMTIECDLYQKNGSKAGRITNGRALCVFPAY